ncbi:MAG TPA: LacI family DNA-binding transcriptional regulator [Spirochaetia bacterium]
MNLVSIAKKAGVSTATVSLALNNRRGVSRRTRERILGIAKEVGYKKRPSRQSVRGTVQFLKVIRHGHTLNQDHNVFIADYIDGITHKAKNVQLRVEFASATAGTPLPELISQMDQQDVAGFLLLGTELSPEDVRAFGSVQRPIVFLDTCYDFLQFDFVDMDNLDSVFLAVSRLARAGHRSIGLVTSPVNVVNFRAREEGFRKSMAYLERPVEERFIYRVDSTFQGAHEDFSAILSSGAELPEALFCCNDIVSLGVARALREAGRRIPDDMSLIGFDNLPASAQSDPPLTTIKVPNQEIGATALLLLKERIENPQKPCSRVLISGELIERQSVHGECQE